MMCPMCKSEKGKVTDSKNTGSLYLCPDCGYSRSHRTLNIYVELWLDFAEEQNVPHEGKRPNSAEELTVLQAAALEK